MIQSEFLEEVCRRGEAEVIQAYAEEDPKREGALAGFALCRGKSANELLVLFEEVEKGSWEKTGEKRSEHERKRYKALQIEWCLNALAALDCLEGGKTFEWLTWHPTVRAIELTTEILREHEAGILRGKRLGA